MIVRESDLEFDFTSANKVTKHDAINTVFPGVDFIVEGNHPLFWLEVKNWEGSSVPPSRRGGQRRAFLAKLHSKQFFREELRGKFIGTCAYLALTNAALREDVLYVAVLESPRMDSALMIHATTRLKGLVKRDAEWHTVDSAGSRIPLHVDAVVINLAEWNSRFPDYPATAI